MLDVEDKSELERVTEEQTTPPPVEPIETETAEQQPGGEAEQP